MGLDEMRQFMDAAPATGDDDFDAKVRGWLATDGTDVEAGDGPPCTVIAVMIDEDGECSTFALPQEVLDEAAHRDLAAVHDAAFEWHFNADLTPDQFAGAFRICGGVSHEPDVFQDQVDELREEMDDEAPDMDWDSLLESVGSWNQYRITSGGRLPGPVAHLYKARLCM